METYEPRCIARTAKGCDERRRSRARLHALHFGQMDTDGATSAGELLLRSDEVDRATLAINAEVHAHIATAMQGPFGVAGAHVFGQSPVDTSDHPGQSLREIGTLGVSTLTSDVLPQRFIGAGVALTVAYTALGDADGVRVAAGLRCAAAALFPNDDDGWATVERASVAAIGHLQPIGDPDSTDPAAATLAMQRQVYAAAESLNRAYLASAARLQFASLSASAWRAVSGGIGPSSEAAASAFGPFLPGLVRFAFFTAVALHFVRRDDWAWVGAALIGARSDVHRGADGLHGLPAIS